MPPSQYIRYSFNHGHIKKRRHGSPQINRRISDDAIQAVVGEQQEQLIQAVLVSSTLDQVLDRTFKTDTYTLANAYGSKARDALVYAQHIAAEDAKIASEILAKDLPGTSSLQTSSSSTRTSLEKGSSSNKSQQE